MITVVAQIPDASPDGIGAWLVILACVLVLLNQGFAFYKNHIREEPRPSMTYAAKDRVENLAKAVASKVDTSVVDGINAQIAKLHADRSSSVARLHARMEELNTSLRKELREDINGVRHMNETVLSAVSRLEGKIEHHKG